MNDQPQLPHQNDDVPYPQPGVQPPVSQQPWPQPSPQAPGPLNQKGTNGLATAGFVLGLLGFLGSFIPVLNVGGITLGVIGVILAALGLAKAKKIQVGKGLSVAGIVLGGLAIIIGILINMAFVSAVDEAINETAKNTVQVPDDSSNDANSDTAPKNDDNDGDDATDEPTTEEDADNQIGTTRDNPAPLGSKITDDDWTVTINSVETVSKDKYGRKAESGNVLLQVNITATYDGDDEQGSSAWARVKFITADGTTIDSLDGSTLFMAEDGFDSLKTVYSGGSVTGDEILEVPKKDWKKGVLAVSPGMFSDDTFIAVK